MTFERFKIAYDATAHELIFEPQKGGEGTTLADLVFKMGDAAGANKVLFRNSEGVDVLSFDSNGNVTMADAANIVLNTTTGTKIGTAAGQKLGFFGAAPVVQQSHVADPAAGTTVDAEARQAISEMLTRLENLGLLASA